MIPHYHAPHRAVGGTPSALEPASFPRAGEARLIERDLGEDAFVVTFHEVKTVWVAKILLPTSPPLD